MTNLTDKEIDGLIAYYGAEGAVEMPNSVDKNTLIRTFARRVIQLEAELAKLRVEQATIIINRIKPLADKMGLEIPKLANVLNVSEEIARNWYLGKSQAPALYEKILAGYALPQDKEGGE